MNAEAILKRIVEVERNDGAHVEGCSLCPSRRQECETGMALLEESVAAHLAGQIWYDKVVAPVKRVSFWRSRAAALRVQEQELRA